MTPLVATITGSVVVLVALALMLRFPEKNLFELLPDLTGSFVGKFIGMLYVLFFIYITGLILRVSQYFVSAAILTKTPHLVVSFSILIAAALGLYYGIEVLARANEFIFLIIIISIILIVILVLPQGDINNITPLFDDGIMPILKGSITFSALRSEIALFLLMLTPIFNEPRDIWKYSIYAVLIVGVVLVITTLTNSFVFEKTEAARMVFPTYELARMVNLGNFIERFDPIVLITWISGTFVKLVYSTT